MRISVIGCGYLGAVHAAGLASMGHDVVGVDQDVRKVEALAQGVPPFHEPGLAELLRDRRRGGLHFTTDVSQVHDAEVHFVCVGTPQRAGGEYAADLSFVEEAVDGLLPHLRADAVVVGKSTVPVGTAERLGRRISQVHPDVGMAWNPEFLREGHAVDDTLHPDRIVIGLPEGDREPVLTRLRAVYADPLAEGVPLLVTDLATAELVKVAANSFLATKISFINAMAELCEVTGADVTQLADAIGCDARIGRRFLDAGLGFGGGCLPKDIRAFMARAGELGVDQALTFLREVDSINKRRRVRMVDLAREECGGSVVGRRIAVLGAAFKPDSDDVRDSPALNVAAQLQLQGAEVVVADPQAVENARDRWPDLKYAHSPEEAVTDAELVMVLTEWREYVDLDPVAVGELVRRRRILDGRNALDPDRWVAAGWSYRALGRSHCRVR